jgi:hypothetical protein
VWGLDGIGPKSYGHGGYATYLGVVNITDANVIIHQLKNDT